jgi:hypothetical protein
VRDLPERVLDLQASQLETAVGRPQASTPLGPDIDDLGHGDGLNGLREETR